MDIRSDHDPAGKELRRDIRFRVTQAASIARPGQPDIPCEIRDFCLGGLFLIFAPGQTSVTSFTALENTEAEIVFSPALPADAPAPVAPVFRIQVQLRRSSPLGVGVAFVRQPVEALRALQKLRMASHRQRLGGSTTAASQSLRETCTTLLRETLMQTHNQLSRIIEDKLAIAAMHAAGIAEHSGLLNAPNEFKKQANALQTKLLHSVMSELTQARRKPVAKPPTPEGLALVDEMDFEDWLSTTSEVTRLEAHFQEQLADIEPRVNQLFGINFDHISNPFAPSLICHTYRNTIQDLPIVAKARYVAYATLREVLIEQLAPLYAELLSLLPVSDAELTNRAPITRDSPDGRTDHPERAAAASASEATSAAQKSALGRLTRSLMDHFRGEPQAFSQSGAAPHPSPAQPATPSPAPAAAGEFAGYAASPVLQRLAAAGSLPQNLNQEMRRSVDMFGALFDTMHAEKTLNEGIRPFFGQLEASLVKLAVSDPAFLGSPSHPAHKVLNTLDRISMIAGEDGKISDERLLRLMRRWTDRINAEAEKNPGVFEEARTQLERVVKPLLNERIARIARLQEICEGRQRAETTKTRVVHELLTRMGERSVPNIVIELINGGWRNVLLMAELRNGEDSSEAHAAWQALDQLSLWLDPAHTESPAPADAQALLHTIDTQLTRVCADKFAQDRILDQLAYAFFDRGAHRPEYTTLSARMREAIIEPASPSHDDLLEKLRVGDWLQFSHLETPLNLVWIGDQPPVYVFATYRGVKKLDLKRQDLLHALDHDEARWTEDMELPLMDRSYSAMIQKMQRDLMWQASHDPVTGLANRRAFFRAIRRDWVRSKNPELDAGYAIGIVQSEVVDLDGKIPDADARNAFMRAMAQQLKNQLPKGSLLARAGEQSIAYWMTIPDIISAKLISTKLLNALNRFRLSIDGRDIRAQAYIGLIWTTNGLDPEGDYDNANAAATAARESGQNAVVLYQNNDSERARPVIALAEWAHELTRILAENRLTLDCQAIRDLQAREGEAVHYEILLHPLADAHAETGWRISTHDLLDVAERLQRITEIDRWVFKRVIHWMRENPDCMEGIAGFSIKLSGQSVMNPLFMNFLLSELGRGDLPTHKIIFAVNEIAAVDGHSQTQHFFRQLQRLGCKFMLDEFGLGTSSYTALKSLRLDYLKLDRSLMRELSSSLIDEAIVRSILETSSFLEIGTIAAFVENEDTRIKLMEMGVQFMQGYLISEPVTLESLAQAVYSD